MVPMLLMAPPHAVKYGEPEPKTERGKRGRGEKERKKRNRKNKVCGSMLILQPRHRRCSVQVMRSLSSSLPTFFLSPFFSMSRHEVRACAYARRAHRTSCLNKVQLNARVTLPSGKGRSLDTPPFRLSNRIGNDFSEFWTNLIWLFLSKCPFVIYTFSKFYL